MKQKKQKEKKETHFSNFSLSLQTANGAATVVFALCVAVGSYTWLMHRAYVSFFQKESQN